MRVKNLAGGFERHLKTALIVFSIIVALGGGVSAQNINDDLKPKTDAQKTKPTVKNSVKTTDKKTVQPKRKVKKTVNARPNQSRNAESKSFVSAETPDQILNRFMSFQQSAGVSDRDWKSLMAQTAKTLETNPNNSMAKAQSLIAQGQIAYNQRNYAMAAIHFKSALQILPQSSLPHYTLGKTYLANGQAAAAERSFKEAIEQNENFALAYKGMGDALTARGETKKATKYYKKATEISVKDGNMPL